MHLRAYNADTNRTEPSRVRSRYVGSRRPLVTALDRLGLREGWKCADVGAGGGDVTVALARVVGRDGRVVSLRARGEELSRLLEQLLGPVR